MSFGGRSLPHPACFRMAPPLFEIRLWLLTTLVTKFKLLTFATKTITVWPDARSSLLPTILSQQFTFSSKMASRALQFHEHRDFVCFLPCLIPSAYNNARYIASTQKLE